MSDDTKKDDAPTKGNFIQNAEKTIKDDVDKVEDKVDAFVHGAKDDVKADEKDVSKDVHEVEAEVKLDGQTVVHDIQTDVKQEEALVKDAEQHPSNAVNDFHTGVTDAEHDVRQEAQVVSHDAQQVGGEAVTDVRDEARKIADQLKADFEKANAAGPGHELTENETPQAWANRINKPEVSANVDVTPEGPGPVPTQAQAAADNVQAQAQRLSEVERAQAQTAAQQPQGPVAPEGVSDAAPSSQSSTGNIEVVEAENDEAVKKAQDENSVAHGEPVSTESNSEQTKPVETTPAESDDTKHEQHV